MPMINFFKVSIIIILMLAFGEYNNQRISDNSITEKENNPNRKIVIIKLLSANRSNMAAIIRAIMIHTAIVIN